MWEWLGIVSTLTGTLAGVVLGWLLRRSDQQRLFEIYVLRNGLKDVYGPLFGIVDKEESKGFQEEPAIWISHEEKKWLDKIVTTYPHMLPDEIRGYWLANIRRMGRARPLRAYPVGLEFRNLVEREYERQLKQYRDLTKVE